MITFNYPKVHNFKINNGRSLKMSDLVWQLEQCCDRRCVVCQFQQLSHEYEQQQWFSRRLQVHLKSSLFKKE